MANDNTNYVSYLIELSQQGRRNAFFDLCEINLKNVFSLAYYLLADYNIAKQITLNVFFHSWDAIKEFNKNQSYLAWLKELAIKHSLFELNRKGLSNSFKKVEKTAISELHQLQRLIFALPDEDRIIFVLHDMEGNDYSETKKYLPQLSEDEIKTKLINAREFIIDNL